MKQVIIGIYDIGYEQIELVLREGTGGDFWNVPERGHIARIKVGADQKEWRVVVGALLHESFELVANRLQLRYDCSDDMGRDHAGYVFVMPHNKFSDCCQKTAEFLAKALPDLARAWKKWNRKTRRNAKK